MTQTMKPEPRPAELWHVTTEDGIETSLMYDGNGGFGPVNILGTTDGLRWHTVKYRGRCQGSACTVEGCTRVPTWNVHA